MGGIAKRLDLTQARFQNRATMSDQFSRAVPVDGVPGRGANMILGLIAGTVAALIGAGIWMGVELATGLTIGYVALGVGALVGLTIRAAGNGSSPVFGIMGAILTLAGCVLGEVMATIQTMTTAQSDFYTIATTIDYSQLISGILDHTTPISYLIYGIGIFEGYKLSMRK